MCGGVRVVVDLVFWVDQFEFVVFRVGEEECFCCYCWEFDVMWCDFVLFEMFVVCFECFCGDFLGEVVEC